MNVLTWDFCCKLLACRAMTISSSHTAAFCKAAMMRCKKPNGLGILTMEDEEGLKDACTTGWSWLVISWKAEQLVESLPAFLQMVLNSSHSVGLGVQELEAAQQIALLCKSGSTMKEAIQSVKTAKPACESYIEVVGLYVQQFGGGPSFPVISFLNKFCQQLSITVAIGEEVFKGVTFWEVAEPSNQFPLVRAGFLACQLTSPKVVDGVAKMMAKADLDKLKAGSQRQFLLKAENLLNDAWKIAEQASDQEEVVSAFGRMLIRTVLHLTKKEKMGREPKGHGSLEVICKLFAQEAKGNVGKQDTGTMLQEDENKPVDLLSGLSFGEQALLQNKHLQVDGKYFAGSTCKVCSLQGWAKKGL